VTPEYMKMNKKLGIKGWILKKLKRE
jgi:hypothetical protein